VQLPHAVSLDELLPVVTVFLEMCYSGVICFYSNVTEVFHMCYMVVQQCHVGVTVVALGATVVQYGVTAVLHRRCSGGIGCYSTCCRCWVAIKPWSVP
jgi:hypothetical protein